MTKSGLCVYLDNEYKKMAFHLPSYWGQLTELVEGELWVFFCHNQIIFVKKSTIPEIMYAYIGAGRELAEEAVPGFRDFGLVKDRK